MRTRVVRVAELLKSYHDIFICALADNLADFYDCFDMIFVLTLDEPVMGQRPESRERTDYGKDTGELSDIFLGQRDFDEGLLAAGAIATGTEKSTQSVADSIIKHLN
jgi:hypothetical protein